MPPSPACDCLRAGEAWPELLVRRELPSVPQKKYVFALLLDTAERSGLKGAWVLLLGMPEQVGVS